MSLTWLPLFSPPSPPFFPITEYMKIAGGDGDGEGDKEAKDPTALETESDAIESAPPAGAE